MFESLKKLAGHSSEPDEAYYAAALKELEGGEVRQGLWAKALSESAMDEKKAKAAYIRLRAGILKKERPRLVEEQQQAEQFKRQAEQLEREQQRRAEQFKVLEEREQELRRQWAGIAADYNTLTGSEGRLTLLVVILSFLLLAILVSVSVLMTNYSSAAVVWIIVSTFLALLCVWGLASRSPMQAKITPQRRREVYATHESIQSQLAKIREQRAKLG